VITQTTGGVLAHARETAARDAERNHKPRKPAGPPEDPDGIHLTDVGNGLKFATEHQKDVRYVPAWGWLHWDGKRWARDDMGRVQELAKQTARRMYAEAAEQVKRIAEALKTATDADKPRLGMQHDAAERLMKWALKSEDARRIGAMLAMARTDGRVAAPVEQFDADPFAFNVENGTLDLRAGALKAHDRGDYLTKLSPVVFDKAANAPTWDRLLSGIFKRDLDLILWNQRWAGYCATGDVREQMVAIQFGHGSNGKSVFIETLLDVYGEYAHKANAELLLAGKHDRHETEKAALAGKRFVAAVETGEGRRLNESLVKECSGGDRITARFMKKDHFTFASTFKLALATNHRPEIRGTDMGIWRRVRLIPFTERFWKPGEPPGPDHLRADPDMREKLKAELPGVLLWIVAGAVAWHRDGLGTCKAIEVATGEYRQTEDKIGLFLDETTEPSPSGVVKATELFSRYKAWAEGRNEHAVTQTKFGLRMTELGYEKRPSNGVKYLGLRFRPTEGLEESDRFPG
jgi:putative DNA primase/helicase